MTNKKISELTAASALDGSELVPIVQGGNSRKLPLAKFASVADMVASSIAYSGGDIDYAEGDIIEAGGFRYEVAASDASDEHLTTAGGLKLYVQQGSRGYDIRAFGGADDWDGATGTNNFDALETLAALPKPVRIFLPHRDTGVYLTDGVTAITEFTGLDGVIIDADEGVSLHNAAGGTPITFRRNVKATSEFRTYWETLRTQRAIKAPVQRPADLIRPGGIGDAELSVPTTLDFTDAQNWQLSSWNNGDWNAATPPGGVLASSVVWNTPPGGTFVGTTFGVVPGDFIQARAITSTAWLPGILVLTDNGWVLVRQSQASSLDRFIKSEKIGAGATVEIGTTDEVGTFEAYRMGRAVVGVKIFDHRSFGLVLNGTVIRRYRTGANIVAAGWAAGFGTSGTAIFDTPVLFKNRVRHGAKPLRIIGIGDSTADPNVTQWSQFDYMRQYLPGIAGAQVAELNNLATSGEKSDQQLARLNALLTDTTTGYDYCCIQIGINDIQNGVGLGYTPTVLADNVEDMVDTCRAAGVEPIVGIPALFYDQPEAQVFDQDGGNTSNSDLGAQHRLVLMQRLEDLGVYCNAMSQEDMGSVIPSLLDFRDGPWGDQIVYDNIHPTAWGAALQGYGWAKAIGAHLTNAKQSGWSTMPTWLYASGIGASGRLRFTVEESTLHLSRSFTTGGTLADGTLCFTLPPRMRPNALIHVKCTSLDGSQAPLAADTILQVAENGEAKIYEAHASAVFISVNASWSI